MRNVKALLAAGMIMLFASVAGADEGSLSGAWQLEIVSPQGTRTPSMVLTQTGNQVSGSYKSQRGEVPISGTITGSDFALTVKIETDTDKLVVEYKGRVQGDALTGKVAMGARGEATFTGKRAGT